MFKRASLFPLVLLLGLFLAACGGDDDKTETTEVDGSSETVVLPAHDVAAKDGAKAHSGSDVVECSSMDLEGDVGSAAFGGFQDVSARGIACETATTRILDVYETYRDGKVAANVDGYSCAVLERLGDGLVTIRCFTDEGDDAFRFTAVPAKKKRVELVSECGTFGRFYDVSVRGQGCQAGATFLDSTPTAELTKIGEGDTVAVGAQTCTTIYVEGDDRTVRCTQGKASLRFSIATRPSTAHPKKYVENPKESSEVVAKTKKEPKRTTNHGLSPVVTISCTATGPFDAITAKGVNCAAVTTLLTQNATEIQAMKRGADPLGLGTPPVFTCARIDDGGETATARCTSPTSGASFRASFLAAPDPGPSGNPPATTTPATAGGAASATPATPAETTATPADAAATTPDPTQ